MRVSRRRVCLAHVVMIGAAIGAGACGRHRLPEPDPAAVAAQIAALRPCPEAAADAVDTTGWRPAPGLDSTARSPYWWAGLHLTLPPEFVKVRGILPCHGGAMWEDTTAQTPGTNFVERTIGLCGGTYPLAKPEPARLRVAPLPLPSDAHGVACLLSFPVFGQRVALIRRRLPVQLTARQQEQMARLGAVKRGGPEGFLWTTWPLEHWEDVNFSARSLNLADTAVALRVLHGLRWTP